MHAHDDELWAVDATRFQSGRLELGDLSIQFTAFLEELGENSFCVEASEHLGA